MRKLGAFILTVIISIVAIVGVIVGWGMLSSSNECDHEYYFSDYKPASVKENGYEEYSCLNCGDVYREVIPMLEETSDQKISAEETTAKKQNLLALPIYSKSGDNVVDPVSFEADILDIEGYHHKNCYQILCVDPIGETEYQRWELNGEYKEVEGTIYMRQGNSSTSYWLEFYSGSELLYTTERLSKESTEVSFLFSVENVEFFSMCCRCEGSNGSWIIADQITISK